MNGAESGSKTVSPDFQSHLADLEAQGLLVRIDRPINKDTELHPLVRCQFIGGIAEDDRRAFLFTNVVDSTGRRYDMPVAVGAFAASPHIYALGIGRAIEDIGADWLNAIKNPIPPVTVTAPPCQEVVIKGDELRRPGGGLAALPVPISTPGFDAAPYLTATLCITADPDSGVRNIGTYRAALKSPNRLGVRMSSRIGGAGGYLHWCKYRDRGERMPCAIVIGAAPVVMYTGPEKLAIDQDELSVAGALAGTAIRTAWGVTVDLEVPADAEIVIEGFIDTHLLEPEGPFGESNGYVALEDFNMSMEVTAITHRRAPVFASMISQVSPSESSVIKKLALEPLFLNHLRDHLSIKSALRVVMHEPLSNLRPIIFVQFANSTPKSEIWRGLQGTAARQADSGKMVIAVSEDIEPEHTDAVMWSLAYRCNPIEDVHIEPYRSGGHSPKSGPAHADSTLLIDATLKYPMAPLALPGREYMERAQALWRELNLPALTPRSPWYGYSLGDWNDIWQGFARNAVAGEWAKNGENTWQRRRGGLTPETPARLVETDKKSDE
ncbi:UbiD family decarboxylase [Sodalis sp. dw_96]|uniref:UbiD family decarboxylase n=1 Tax=Sodalis sp. dw_96 TaxID=2719794 RepID=UPI001BD67BC3|nr:UbiD family decarboxylase [Sodalis sp. dw_96]